jgi:hypothetical protein
MVYFYSGYLDGLEFTMLILYGQLGIYRRLKKEGEIPIALK